MRYLRGWNTKTPTTTTTIIFNLLLALPFQIRKIDWCRSHRYKDQYFLRTTQFLLCRCTLTPQSTMELSCRFRWVDVAANWFRLRISWCARRALGNCEAKSICRIYNAGKRAHDVLRSIFRRTTECVVRRRWNHVKFNKEARNSKHTKVFWLSEQLAKMNEFSRLSTWLQLARLFLPPSPAILLFSLEA